MQAIGRWLTNLVLAPTPYAAGMCRIALAIHFILIQVYYFWNISEWHSKQPHALYQPVGIMNLYRFDAFPLNYMIMWATLAKISVIFMLLGCYSRLSLAVATVAMLHCCSGYYSYMDSISHTFIPGLFAGIGLSMGVRSPLSIDYYLVRKKAHGELYWQTPRAGVMMAMFAVGWPLANAAIFKIYLGNQAWLAWIYSDNLRNVLIFQWWKFQQPIPIYLEWIVRSSWAAKGMALGNVLAQLLPLIGCFLVRSKWLRLILALLILCELIGLSLAMNMWRGYGRLWLAFIVLMVDWDTWFRRPPADMNRSSSIRLALGYWVIILLWTIPIIAMTCTPQYHRNRYPIQPFSMFSSIQAKQPYGETKPYPILISEWEIESTPPLTDEQRAQLFTGYHTAAFGHPEAALERVRVRCENDYRVQVEQIKAIQSFHVIPVAPATDVVREPRTLMIEWRRDRTPHVQSLSLMNLKHEQTTGAGKRYSANTRMIGGPFQNIQFGYFRGLDPEMKTLDAIITGGRYELIVPPGDGDVILVIQATNSQGERQRWFGYYIQAAN